MFYLSTKWKELLTQSPESGMGYHIATVLLKNGTQFDQVVIIEGLVSQVRGLDHIPFTEDDIQKIIITHDKWDFGCKFS